jgi:hypothetical protein
MNAMYRYALGALTLLPLVACGPNYNRVASQRLDQIIKLENRNAVLEGKLKESQAHIDSLRQQLASNTPRIATLPPERLNDLLTAATVELRHSTDMADFDGDGKRLGFRVYLRPVTADGQPIPATGSVTIEAFDLALKDGSQRIGVWTFKPTELKANWYSGFGLNQFALNCPWKEPPQHDAITFKVVFIDALTGETMTDQALIQIHRKPK